MSTLTRLQEKYEKLWAKREARIAELEDALRELQGAAEIVCEQLDSVGSVALGDCERLRAMATIAHGVLGEAK